MWVLGTRHASNFEAHYLSLSLRWTGSFMRIYGKNMYLLKSSLKYVRKTGCMSTYPTDFTAIPELSCSVKCRSHLDVRWHLKKINNNKNLLHVAIGYTIGSGLFCTVLLETERARTVRMHTVVSKTKSIPEISKSKSFRRNNSF